MASNIFTLDDQYQWFVEMGRIDPMTREQFRTGDRVVVCRECNMASLESTWDDCGGCTAPGCGCKATAKRFIKAPPPKPRSRADGLNHIVLTNGQVARTEPATAMASDGETPKMIIKARHFYN